MIRFVLLALAILGCKSREFGEDSVTSSNPRENRALKPAVVCEESFAGGTDFGIFQTSATTGYIYYSPGTNRMTSTAGSTLIELTTVEKNGKKVFLGESGLITYKEPHEEPVTGKIEITLDPHRSGYQKTNILSGRSYQTSCAVNKDKSRSPNVVERFAQCEKTWQGGYYFSIFELGQKKALLLRSAPGDINLNGYLVAVQFKKTGNKLTISGPTNAILYDGRANGGEANSTDVIEIELDTRKTGRQDTELFKSKGVNLKCTWQGL